MRPHFYIALILAGCATNGYQWYSDGFATEFYRWKVVDRESFKYRCGFIAPDQWNSGGACVVRMRDAVILPGDKPTSASGAVKGSLCVVLATMTEDEAERMRDWDGDKTLAAHERLHCAGLVHTGGPRLGGQ